MDHITEIFLKEFSKNFGFEKLDTSDQFEYFADYCAITNETIATQQIIAHNHTNETTLCSPLNELLKILLK